MPSYVILKEVKVKFGGNWTIENKLIFKSWDCDHDFETDSYFVYDISVMKISGIIWYYDETIAQLQIISRFNIQSIRKTYWMFNISVEIIHMLYS